MGRMTERKGARPLTGGSGDEPDAGSIPAPSASSAAQGRECEHNRTLLPGTTKKPTDPLYVYAESREEAQRLLDNSYLKKYRAVPVRWWSRWFRV